VGTRAQRKRQQRESRRVLALPVGRSVEQLLDSATGTRAAEENDLAAAQELVYEALESKGSKRVGLARRALAISADCADAYGILAEEAARSLQEKRDLYAAGVAAGERALGKDAFEHDAGSFWGLIETRPYMRVRAGLAACLWHLGQREEAITHYSDLLRLNPADNQGIRYTLSSCLLALGRDEEAEALLYDPDYEEDAGAVWVFARALLAFRQKGAGTLANGLLAEAVETNPLVPPYLTGARRIPRRVPELIGFGDDSEAIACAADQLEAWESTPGALDWLRRETLPQRSRAKGATDRKADSRPPQDRQPERRRWLFPNVSGTFNGIDLAGLDPANPDDRRFLITAQHPRYARAIDRGDDLVSVKGRTVNPHLHIALHEVVANQVWDGNPAFVWPTVERLRHLGYRRHDILHMLGFVVTEELANLRRSRKEPDAASYARALATLPESWHAEDADS